MTARELFASKPSRKGEVRLPVSFDDISVLMGLSMEDSVTREIAFIEENKNTCNTPRIYNLTVNIKYFFYNIICCTN